MYWMTASRSVERQLVPGRHRRAAHPAGDRAQQVAVGRQRLLGQPELEHGGREAARALVVHEGRGRPVAVAVDAMATEAPSLIDLAAVGDPFARARKGGFRDFQLLRLEEIAPLAAVHAELLEIGDEVLPSPPSRPRS